MSSCLSGGGGRAAAYGFDLEIVKSPPSTSTTTRATSHNTPSPSSTLSESYSPLVISTRKPRTPRKRPNETYNEAAALLSTAYPNVFFSNHSNVKKSPSSSQFFGIKSPHSDFDEASELLLPFESIEEPDFLFHPPLQSKTVLFFDQKEKNVVGKNRGGAEIDDSTANQLELIEDFDAESILEEEIEEGIDSIMGNVESNDEENRNHGDCKIQGINLRGNCHGIGQLGQMMMNPWYRRSMEFGFARNFQLGFGLRSAIRDNDDANWWRFPTVDFDQISPRNQTTAKAEAEKKSKKKKKKKVSSSKEDPRSKKSGPLLKLNYDGVMEAWSEKASPFSDEIRVKDSAGADVH